MALATETDPVQLILDILDASVAGDYDNANGKPGRIVRSGEFSPGEKRAYEQTDALYLYAVGDVTKQPIGGSGQKKMETAQVAADVWTLDGEGLADTLAEDVEDIVDAYWTDNKASTEWTTVRVVSENDYTHEAFRSDTVGQHDRHLVTAELMRNKSVGL